MIQPEKLSPKTTETPRPVETCGPGVAKNPTPDLPPDPKNALFTRLNDRDYWLKWIPLETRRQFIEQAGMWTSERDGNARRLLGIAPKPGQNRAQDYNEQTPR